MQKCSIHLCGFQIGFQIGADEEITNLGQGYWRERYIYIYIYIYIYREI